MQRIIIDKSANFHRITVNSIQLRLIKLRGDLRKHMTRKRGNILTKGVKKVKRRWGGDEEGDGKREAVLAWCCGLCTHSRASEKFSDRCDLIKLLSSGRHSSGPGSVAES